MDHTVLLLPTNFFCPAVVSAVVAAAVSVDTPTPLPPTPAFYIMVVPPISVLCKFCSFVPTFDAFPPPQISSPVPSSSRQRPQKSPGCVGPTTAHYCCPSRFRLQRWYQPLLLPDPPYSFPAASVPLPHSPLLIFPCTCPYSLSHAQSYFSPSASVLLTHSPPILLYRNWPQHQQNSCRSTKLPSIPPPSRCRSAPVPHELPICLSYLPSSLISLVIYLNINDLVETLAW